MCDTKVIHRGVTRPVVIDRDQQDQCASCNVPINRCSNYISIILSWAHWEHWERRILVRDLPGGCGTVDDAEELAIFCSQECLQEGLRGGIA